MLLGIVKSMNGVNIRLTRERWDHITTSHLELNPRDYKLVLNIVANPDIILKGDTKELLSVKKQPRKRVWIVVAYKETLLLRNKEVNKSDGFVLTAYITTNSHWLFQKEVLWNKE